MKFEYESICNYCPNCGKKHIVWTRHNTQNIHLECEDCTYKFKLLSEITQKLRNTKDMRYITLIYYISP